MRKRFILLPIYFGFFVVLMIFEITNPTFSSNSLKIGNYEVQVSTNPTVPDVGKDTKIHFLVLDQDGNQVNKFRMSLKIYFNDQLEQTFQAADYPGTWDAEYIFQESGNHVLRADLFDLKTGNVNSYAFNITVLNLYESIFVILIIAGVAGAVGIIMAIIIYQRKTKSKRE